MVFVRDRQSSNGTKVNKVTIGQAPKITAGRLLEDGDVVTVGADLEFTVNQPTMSSKPLTRVQALETGVSYLSDSGSHPPLRILTTGQLFREDFVISSTVIGTGATSRVHIAYDVKTGQQLACKIYDLSRLDDHEITQILRGIDLVIQLDHPNVASFRRAYKSKHSIYMLEELATGGDLWSMTAARGRYRELEVCWIMRQLLLAVDYLHKKGVVHRDIKQENVLMMVCPQPSHRIAITDFGHSDTPGMPHNGVGTHGWQAPEMYEKSSLKGMGGFQGFPMDMWSMGIMAGQLLTGHCEVPALEILEKHVEKPGKYDFKSVDYESIFEDINRLRSESASGHELREDFIRRCLTIDQCSRMTAAEALKHPWVDESPEMRAMFLNVQEKNTEAWAPRTVYRKPVKSLPDVLESPKNEEEEELSGDKLTDNSEDTIGADYKTGMPKTPSQIGREMGAEERMYLFREYKGKLGDASASAHVGLRSMTEYDRRHDHKTGVDKYVPRNMTWPLSQEEATAEEKNMQAALKKRARGGEDSGADKPAKKRKVTRTASQKKLTEQWKEVYAGLRR